MACTSPLESRTLPCTLIRDAPGGRASGRLRRDERGALLARLAVPMVVVVIALGLFLGRVDDLVLMLGRAVEGVEPERSIAAVANIVPRAGRNDDPAAIRDIIAVVVDKLVKEIGIQSII